MSKIIEHTSNGFKWLLVEVPEDATGFSVMKNSVRWKTSPNKYWWDQLILPSEGWEIVSKADSLTGSQIEHIVERSDYGTLKRWLNYENRDSIMFNISDSFLSLLRTHGLKISETLILKSTQLL